MPRPRKNPRPIEEVMAADIIKVHSEGPRRYPFSTAYFYMLKNQGRIRVFGREDLIRCSEFEAQMELGFPVIKKKPVNGE